MPSLNPRQFMHVEMLKTLPSLDYGVPVRDLDRAWKSDQSKDPEIYPDQNPNKFMRTFTDHVRKHGVREPLVITHNYDEPGPALFDGNHRAIAAIRAGKTRVPVKHIVYNDDGGYTVGKPKGRR